MRGERPGPSYDWDEYAGWIEMRCPHHGLSWKWVAGIPTCPVCWYTPEPAIEASPWPAPGRS